MEYDSKSELFAVCSENLTSGGRSLTMYLVSHMSIADAQLHVTRVARSGFKRDVNL